MKRIELIAARLAGGTLLAALLVGCGDSPSGVRAPVVSAVEEVPGTTAQTAMIGEAVPIAPTVVVKDALGRPMSGVQVMFTVTAGGGAVEYGSTKTDLAGTASAGRWTLGTTAGHNALEARAGSVAPVVFTATSTAPPVTPPVGPPAPPPPFVPPPGTFNITVRYLTTPTLRQQDAVAAAVRRWESAIVGDLANVMLNAPKGACNPAQPALNELVDDLLLLIDFADIDGAGKVLGEAGPCYIRTESNLPVVGHMKLDAKDLEMMAANGTLDDVVLHELGHILGIGTLWSTRALLHGAGTEDPLFMGAYAVDAYRSLGGLVAGVPVENTGGEGTREGHWRESVFGSELMTGWVGTGTNPLSGMTVASLQDLGYGASLAAAGAYTLRFSSTQSVGIDLRGREHVRGPRYRIDRKGNRETIRPD